MMEQRTDEWFAARLGKITASRIADLCAKTKSGTSASRANYAAQLIAERLTGIAPPSFSNAAMDWGALTEAEARDAYAWATGGEVEETGFIDHPTLPMTGASPDGLVGVDGLVEIKCPQTATHIDTLLGGGVPEKYVLQIQWQLACTGRAWADFASYDPRLPPAMRLFVRRLQRDDARIAALQREVATFHAEVAATIARLHAATTPARSEGPPDS